jgi:hypothetical protein
VRDEAGKKEEKKKKDVAAGLDVKHQGKKRKGKREVGCYV